MAARRPDGFWGRLFGFDGHHEGHPDGINEAGPSFDYSFAGVQVGLDLHRAETDTGARDRAGVYAAFGHAEADVEHVIGGRTIRGGDSEFDAWSLGGYWTRTDSAGWYVDGVAQWTWYDMTMTADRGIQPGETDGWGLAASVEGGYPFALRDSWAAEPQGQLVYQTFDIDDFSDGAADVHYTDLNSLAGRIGARLVRTWDGAGPGEPPEPMAAWARVNFWHAFTGEPTAVFSGLGNSVPFTADIDSTWAEIGVGADLALGPTASLYGHFGYEVTLDGEADAIDGVFGVKFRW